MALRGTLTHRKTRRLGKALGIPACFALGILESLWHVTAEQAPDGAIGRMTDQDIADEMFYDGDATALIEALIVAELVERDPEHRLIVHDWHIHSDDSADLRLARAREYYAGGHRPRMKRLEARQRKDIEADYDRMEAKGGDSACAHMRTEAHCQSQSRSLFQSQETPHIPSQARGGVDFDSSTVAPAQDSALESTLSRKAVRRAIAESGEAALWTAAVDGVMLGMDSADRKLRDQVERAMYGAVQYSKARGKPEAPDEVGVRMVSAWREYNSHGDLLRFRLGSPLAFLSSGIWADQSRWPWDLRAMERRNGASIGMA